MQQIINCPSKLDSSIFLTMKMPSAKDVEQNVLGNALLHWEKCSRMLAYENEANAIHTLAVVVFQSSNILATKSLRVNQMCRDIVCSISQNITARLSSVLVNGCCVEIYQRLICILHSGGSSIDCDKSKISSIISFLNSDKEFLEMLKAHQNIEDSHRLLNFFNPRLKLSHSSAPPHLCTNQNGIQCGKCAFRCIMEPQ